MAGQIIGDNTTVGFTGAGLNLTSPKKLGGGIHEVILDANQKLVEFAVLWLPTPANGTTGNRTLQVCLYDVSTNIPIPGTITNISFNVAALVAAAAIVHVSSGPLDVDLSAHAGKRVSMGLAPPNAAGNSGFVVGIRTLTGSTRYNHNVNSATIPSPFVVASSVPDTSWGIFARTEDIPLASPVITNVNGGTGVRANSTANVATSAGVWAGDVNTGTLGGKSLVITGFNVATGDITFTMPNYVDGATYPRPNGTHSVQFSDGTYSPTLNGIQLNPPAGKSITTVASPDNSTPKKLGYWLAMDGRAPVNGDILIGVTADATWNADTGGSSAGPLPKTTEVIFWQQSSGLTYFYNVTINTDGEITGALSLKSKIKRSLKSALKRQLYSPG